MKPSPRISWKPRKNWLLSSERMASFARWKATPLIPFGKAMVKLFTLLCAKYSTQINAYISLSLCVALQSMLNQDYRTGSVQRERSTFAFPPTTPAGAADKTNAGTTVTDEPQTCHRMERARAKKNRAINEGKNGVQLKI